jgi:hypothetical protein
MSFVTPLRNRRVVLLIVGCVAAAMGGFTLAGNAGADSPTAPTSMVITDVSSATSPPTGLPPGSAPRVLVKAGDPISVTVAFYIGTTPTSFGSDTSLKITSTAGTPSPASVVAPADAQSVTFTTSVATVANRVGLTVTVAKGPSKGLTTGTPNAAQRFDVLSDLQFRSAPAGAAFTDGIGGDDGHCGNATRSYPVCGVVVLPNGAACVGDGCSAPILLSTGACDTTYAKCGSTSGVVIQTLFNDGGLYSRTDPAALIVKCDKSLCGGGAIQGVRLNFSPLGDAALESAPDCPAKGIVGPDQTACVDYVQSKRDNSGDSILYLLFGRDMRGSVG